MRITLSEKQLDQLRTQSIDCYPEEACALLVGCNGNDGEFETHQIVQAANVADNKIRFFEVDPAVRFKIERELRGMPERIIAVFHSHPNGQAEPSQADAEMVIEREFVWLIAAIDGHDQFDIGAFSPLVAGHGFEVMELQVKQGR